MDNIEKDIRKIQELAQNVKSCLYKNKINKAKKGIIGIIRYDFDEFSRLKKGELLKECSQVMADAKKALKDLDSKELFPEAKQLIDEIIKLEDHELIEVQEKEKIRNKLYQIWFEYFYEGVFYHGTTSLSLEKIKRYGLVPGMVPWNKHDVDRLEKLIKRSGNERGLGLYSGKQLQDIQNGKLSAYFITRNYSNAKDYAKKAPEMWSLLRLNQDDYNTALKVLKTMLVLPDFNKRSNELRSRMLDDERFLEKYLVDNCRLNRKELNEAVSIFNKLWKLFENSKPVVLTITRKAPPIMKIKFHEMSYGYPFRSFQEFLNVVGYDTLDRWEDLIHGTKKLMNMNEIEFHERIPSKYITKYEYV